MLNIHLNFFRDLCIDEVYVSTISCRVKVNGYYTLTVFCK